jgi:hypothetical protein
LTGLALACNSFPEHAGNLEALTNRTTALRCPFALGLAGARRLPLTSWCEAPAVFADLTGLALACAHNSFPEHAGNLEALTNQTTALRCPSALGLAGARRLPLTSWHEAGTFRLCSGLVEFRGCSKLALELLSSVGSGCNKSVTFAELRCSVGRKDFLLS